MFVELHLLQNFAPSCLNRDDTNTPKDCEFGGHRRARISSQCIKRAVRRYFREQELLPADHLAERSKRLVGEVVRLLRAKGRPEEQATALVKTALASVKLRADDRHETQYLLFLGSQEISALADVVHASWDALARGQAAAPAGEAPAPEGDRKGQKKSKRQEKAEARGAVPPEVARKVKALFDGGKAADVALFGRMLADQADLSRHAACQVAHAFSTNKVSMEMDFFTAVDDLKDCSAEAGAGAGMLGTVEFNSACFYRYANLDFAGLTRNLQDDVGLARKTVEAFLTASVYAIPSGKQNTFAAHNPPSLVLAVARDRGLYSLANAFERPLRPDHDGSLVQNSVAALDAYWGRLGRMYGTDGVLTARACVDDETLWQPRKRDEPDTVPLRNLLPCRAETVAEVIAAVMARLPNGKGVR
jgi:CRISPR system Cascade subunit CasC